MRCCGYEIHVADSGASHAPVILAWHGLARTGCDMDELAMHLVQRGWRVLCPDTLGRGLSQWSRDPGREYTLAVYARLAEDPLEQLGVDRLQWVGTSMGGAIGTVCAAGLMAPRLRGRITRLVLNDNAPQLAAAALERIKAYAGQPPVFDTVLESEAFFRQVYKPYGWLSDAQWRRLTETSLRRLADGRVTPHYDPAMVQQFTQHDDDYLIWQHCDRLDIPLLLRRGAESDLVLHEAVAEMQRRGPGARGLLQVVQVPGCGHAPALNVPAQLACVQHFLQGDPLPPLFA